MDVETLKQKILNGEIMDEELSDLIANRSGSTKKQESGFLKTMLNGFMEGYVAPSILRVRLESLLILFVIIGIVILSFVGRLDEVITAVLLSFVLGFLFGKIK